MFTNILIVDDEIGPRESLRMILKPLYNVFIAENGTKAMDIIRKEQIDVVTLDMRMPGIQGTEVLKSIKKYRSDIEVIIVTGYGTLKTAIEGIRWGVFDYITKPFNVSEIIAVIKKAADRRILNLQFKSLLQGVKDMEMKVDFNSAKNTLIENQMLIERLRKLFIENTEDSKKVELDFLEFIKVLSSTLESKDAYTHGHSGRVSYYANAIAQHCGFDELERKELQIATMLHDIGKVGIDNQCLLKESDLTEEEWQLIKQHPERGIELIEPLKLSDFIVDVVLHHHERLDGLGYPDGLSGESISLPARIAALADSFDVMTSDRPYRKALSKEEVIKEMRIGSGTQFDSQLIELMLSLLQDNKSNIFF
ncbi:MAG: response regulator [Candidatus Schekmanbacteria bacterium]|nr:response regulator [Candidatus Schekmanbacteria bacterium]